MIDYLVNKLIRISDPWIKLDYEDAKLYIDQSIMKLKLLCPSENDLTPDRQKWVVLDALYSCVSVIYTEYNCCCINQRIHGVEEFLDEIDKERRIAFYELLCIPPAL